jgi:hypothetical protein
LNETYLPKANAKFSRPAADAADAHIPPWNVNLSDILYLEYEEKNAGKWPDGQQCRIMSRGHFNCGKTEDISIVA